MKKLFFIAPLMAVCGCFTLHETEYPAVQSVSTGGAEIGVQLAGFEASVTSYVPVYGYQTVFHPGHRRRGGWMSTYMTETYIPKTEETSAYRDRATDILEKGGFIVRTDNPEYRVEVKFSGPYVTDGDNMVSAAWSLFSLFSADYGVQKWNARLKVYEISSGRLLMSHDYSQRYQAVVWGPLPIFSPAGSELTSFNSMQSWCLSALVDCAMADAAAFIAGRRNPAGK